MAERLHRGDDDRGAVIVLLSIFLVVLMVSAALVVDLGLARQARRSNQSAADLAALAAGEALAVDPAPDARTACADAVDYIVANVGAIPSAVAVPCNTLPASCDATTVPVTVSDGSTAGDYLINITYPVSDLSISDPGVADASALRFNDGLPCERLQVELTNVFDSLFGGIVGKDDFSVRATSVVRTVQASDRRIPALWLLDPFGCTSLAVSGGSSVTVGNATRAGLITIDSDGTACGGSSFTVDSGGTGSNIHAVPNGLPQPAEISLVAMERLQATCSTGNLNACDPADVASLNVYPQPVRRANPATRAPVDHVYNCRPSYPDYHGTPVSGCTNGGLPHIDQLRSDVGASGTPAGFQLWSDTYGCNNPTVPATGVVGNWHVDCGTFRITSATVDFNGGNVIFDGNITLTGGSLSFNTANPTSSLPAACLTTMVGCTDESSADAAWVFQRSGNLTLTGGILNVEHATIYQEDGYFSIAGGSPPTWSAPIEGPFAGLAVWSEKATNKYKINGGASLDLEGTFFTPEATPMSISGGAPVIPQEAQFVSRQLAITGGAALTLSPNSTSGVSIPADPPLLIR